MIKKLAFTIAEVLITLSIIGIVAEMTIPTMIQNYQKQVYVTRLQKFYSEFQQGMRTYMAQKGCMDMACTGMFDLQPGDYGEGSENFGKAINEIFKTIKHCPPEEYDSTGEYKCAAPDPKYGPVKSVHRLGDYSTAGGGQFEYGYSFITLDGFLVSIYMAGLKCPGHFPNSTISQCAEVSVDINGDTKPNTFGRDVFYLTLGNNGILYPYGGAIASGGQTTASYWKISKDCGEAGSSVIPAGSVGNICAARIMDEGWKMNY